MTLRHWVGHACGLFNSLQPYGFPGEEYGLLHTGRVHREVVAVRTARLMVCDSVASVMALDGVLIGSSLFLSLECSAENRG